LYQSDCFAFGTTNLFVLYVCLNPGGIYVKTLTRAHVEIHVQQTCVQIATFYIRKSTS
jgi:hypothetical protein